MTGPSLFWWFLKKEDMQITVAATHQVVVKTVSSICNCVSTIESLTVEYKQLAKLKLMEV